MNSIFLGFCNKNWYDQKSSQGNAKNIYLKIEKFPNQCNKIILLKVMHHSPKKFYKS